MNEATDSNVDQNNYELEYELEYMVVGYGFHYGLGYRLRYGFPPSPPSQMSGPIGKRDGDAQHEA